MRNSTLKLQLFVFLAVFLGLFTITSPYWLWYVKPSSELDVLIYDKTVPNQTYREHKGLVWILNHEKFLKRNKEKYSFVNDYSGFKPVGNQEFKIKLLPENLDKYKLLYLADSYGVYEEEFYGSNRLGERSNSIYAGLEQEEINRIEETLVNSKDKTLIAEFNTFASPTNKEVRTKLMNLLNISWSGWIGRYFSDLNSDEVPVWVKENYELAGHKWNLTGSGVVLINQDDFVVVINKEELAEKGVLFNVTANGKVNFKRNLTANYGYWFDIITSQDKEEVLATYHIPLNAKGEQKLKKYGIPSEFPAVTFHKNTLYSAYYFAGDYADEADVPSIYQTRGISYLKQMFGAKDAFYWKAYVPMMKEILHNGLHKESKENEVEPVIDPNQVVCKQNR